MIRVILIIAFIGVVAFAVTALLGTMRMITDADGGKEDAMLPANMSRITYILLLILLIGVTTGLLGGA